MEIRSAFRGSLKQDNDPLNAMQKIQTEQQSTRAFYKCFGRDILYSVCVAVYIYMLRLH